MNLAPGFYDLLYNTVRLLDVFLNTSEQYNSEYLLLQQSKAYFIYSEVGKKSI